MAKEEQELIGFNKTKMAVILAILAVISYAAFWKDRGGSEAKAEAVHESVVSSLLLTDQRHDREISKNAREVKTMRDEQHRLEVARTALEGKVDNIGSGVTEMKQDFRDFKQFLMQYDYDKKKETD